MGDEGTEGSGIFARQVNTKARLPRRNTAARLKTGMWAETARALSLNVCVLKSG